MSGYLPQHLLERVVDYVSNDTKTLRCLLASATCFEHSCRTRLYSQFTVRVGRPSPSPIPDYLEVVSPYRDYMDSMIVNLRATGRLYPDEQITLQHFGEELIKLSSLSIVFPARTVRWAYHPPNLNAAIALFPSFSVSNLCLENACVEPSLLTRFLLGYPRVRCVKLHNLLFLDEDAAARHPGAPIIEDLILSEPKDFFAKRLPTHSYPFSVSGIRKLALFNGPEMAAPWKDVELLLQAVRPNLKDLYLSFYLTEVSAAEPEITAALATAMVIPSVTIETMCMDSATLPFVFLFMTVLRDALREGTVRIKELEIVVALHVTAVKAPKVETWHILAAILEQSPIDKLRITLTNAWPNREDSKVAFGKLLLAEWEREIEECFVDMVGQKTVVVRSVLREDVYSRPK